MNASGRTSQSMVALVLACLCLSGRCRAFTTSSTQPFNDSGLSGKQIVSIGLAKFTSYYEKRYPRAKGVAPCIIYYDYKELDNKRRTARLSVRHQQRVAQLCRVLQEWAKTASHLRYDSTPGTGWCYLDELSAARFEECRGQVLDSYEHPQRYAPGHSARSVHAMRGGYLLLRCCERERTATGAMLEDDFRRAVPLFRRQTTLLANTLRTQSLAAQRTVAKYLTFCAERLDPIEND